MGAGQGNGVLATLIANRAAVGYYLLGGITFLPICAALFLAHFYLTAARVGATNGKQSVTRHLHDDQAGTWTEQRKREALDLAVWNTEAQQSVEDSKEKDAAIGSSTAPAAAKRMGPPPQLPRKPHRAGWLVVRRNFQADIVTQHLQNAAALATAQNKASKDVHGSEKQHSKEAGDEALEDGQRNENDSEGGRGTGYMSIMYRNVLNYRNKAGHGANKAGDSGASTPDTSTSKQRVASDGSGKGTSTPEVVTPSAISSATSNGREAFHCILKGPVLFLYSAADPNSPGTECHAAIDLRHKRISIFVAGAGDTMGEPDGNLDVDDDVGGSTDLSATEAEEVQRVKVAAKLAKRMRVREGELFVKRNAIRIVSMGTNNNVEGTRFAQWFIFAKNAFALEDWYHALVQASLLPDGHDAIFATANPVGPAFSSDDMTNLLAELDTVPDPIPLRWLNAMVGRIFFSIYRTAWLETYIKNKMMKKIARVRTPSYLSDIKVQEVDLGRTPPAFSRPMLKSLTGDGEASMEVNVHYRGAIRLTISTTLTISLGSRFKQYSVSLVLAVILHSLEGNLLLQIKPPPSNRLWFGFTKLPKMEIDIEPVVSERKVQWSMVKRLLEGRIRELLTESLVVPNMDDVPFFDSRPYDRRGGIWAEMVRDAWRRNVPKDGEVEAPVDAPLDNSAGEGAASKSKSTPASLHNVKTEDDEGKEVDGDGDTVAAISTSFDKSGSETALRNRRVGTIDSALNARSESSSPAAAGLSTLLARDKALSSEPGDGRAAHNRRSWFGNKAGGSAKSFASTNSRRANQQQSSLAWGSASLDPASVKKPAETDAAPSIKPSDLNVALLEPAAAESEVTDDSTAVNEAATLPDDASHAEFDASADMADANDAVETGPSTTPEMVLPTQPTQAATSEDKPNAPPLPKRSATGSSAISTQPTPPPPPPRRPNAIRSNSRGSQASPSFATSPAAQSLASIQRERYSTPSSSKEQSGRNAASSAALAATWQRAKASMADKESRQAAAKDAKDALKRGWANWNARRAGQGTTTPDTASMPSSSTHGSFAHPQEDATDSGLANEDQTSGSRVSRSRTSSWLASSPEDPISLGMGFDVHENLPAPPEMWLDERGTRSPRPDASSDHTAHSSRASSVSGKKNYREHLMHKKTASNAGAMSSQTSSRRSSVQLGAGTPEMAHEGDFTIPVSTSSESGWEAAAPGVSAPLPIARKSERGQSNSPEQNARADVSSSPSSIRRTPSKSTPKTSEVMGKTDSSSGASASSYNFTPGQALATTSLSGFDNAGLSEAAKSTNAAPNIEPRTVDAIPSQSEQVADGAMTETSGLGKEEVLSVMNLDSADKTDLEAPTAPETSPKQQQGIKQQPKRANMMAVPGIPSMQKQGPQSFEAPHNVKASGTGTSRQDVSPGDKAGMRLGLGGFFPRLPNLSPPRGNSALSTPAADDRTAIETTPDSSAMTTSVSASSEESPSSRAKLEDLSSFGLREEASRDLRSAMSSTAESSTPAKDEQSVPVAAAVEPYLKDSADKPAQPAQRQVGSSIDNELLRAQSKVEGITDGAPAQSKVEGITDGAPAQSKVEGITDGKPTQAERNTQEQSIVTSAPVGESAAAGPKADSDTVAQDTEM